MEIYDRYAITRRDRSPERSAQRAIFDCKKRDAMHHAFVVFIRFIDFISLSSYPLAEGRIIREEHHANGLLARGKYHSL